MENKYYRLNEFCKMFGYPKARLMELCRAGKIGIKSDPQAERGFHYLVTLREVRRHWNE